MKNRGDCTKDLPDGDKTKINDMIDGMVLAYNELSEDFEMSAEAMVTLTGYSFASFKTKGIKSVLGRLEKYIPMPKEEAI